MRVTDGQNYDSQDRVSIAASRGEKESFDCLSFFLWLSGHSEHAVRGLTRLNDVRLTPLQNTLLVASRWVLVLAVSKETARQ